MSIICASVKMGKAKIVTLSAVFASFGAFLCENSEKFGVFWDSHFENMRVCALVNQSYAQVCCVL